MRNDNPKDFIWYPWCSRFSQRRLTDFATVEDMESDLYDVLEYVFNGELYRTTREARAKAAEAQYLLYLMTSRKNLFHSYWANTLKQELTNSTKKQTNTC